MTAYARFKIKVGMVEIQEDVRDDVMEVVVDNNLHMPDMVVLQLYDDDLEWVDDKRFDLGAAMEVSVDNVIIFKGEITSLEPDFAESGRATLLIRGYDKSHRLHRGRKTRTFMQMTDSQIVSKVVREAGLTAQIAPTVGINEYVVQNNQTDMEFLLSRARRLGYQLFTSEDKIVFKKGDAVLDGPILEWKESLRSFRPRWAGAHQVSKFEVQGWDNENKMAIKGTGQPQTVWKQGGMTNDGGKLAETAFRGGLTSPTGVVVNHPVANRSEASALAEAMSHEASSQFVQAEGVCFGEPKLQAGQKIQIKGVGRRFSGAYYVTAATHVYREGRYETNFTISGQLPNTLSELLDGAGNQNQSLGLVQGVMVGIVSSLRDPKNLGRIKVKFPTLVTTDMTEADSHWVRIASPMGGKDSGFFYLPEVGDEVLIGFEHGDLTRAYMLGALWNNRDRPPTNSTLAVGVDGKVNKRMLKSRSGHSIVLDDTLGLEQITIRDKTGLNEIVIDTKMNTLTINMMKDINVTATGNMSFKALGNISMECLNMNIKTLANYELKALANVDVVAMANSLYRAMSMSTVEGIGGLILRSAVPDIVLAGPAVTVNKGALVVI